MTAKDPHDLPQEDQADLEYEAFMKSMGLVHISEVITMEGDMSRIAHETFRSDMMEAVKRRLPELQGASVDAQRAVLGEIVRSHLAVYEQRLLDAGFPPEVVFAGKDEDALDA